MYRQLTIIQRIAFKGWIKHQKCGPNALIPIVINILTDYMHYGYYQDLR